MSVELAKDYFYSKNELQTAEKEYQTTSDKLDHAVAMREEREALQREHTNMVEREKAKEMEQERVLERGEKVMERGGFEMGM